MNAPGSSFEFSLEIFYTSFYLFSAFSFLFCLKLYLALSKKICGERYDCIRDAQHVGSFSGKTRLCFLSLNAANFNQFEAFCWWVFCKLSRTKSNTLTEFPWKLSLK